jgi:hypothetical protein
MLSFLFRYNILNFLTLPEVHGETQLLPSVGRPLYEMKVNRDTCFRVYISALTHLEKY